MKTESLREGLRGGWGGLNERILLPLTLTPGGLELTPSAESREAAGSASGLSRYKSKGKSHHKPWHNM